MIHEHREHHRWSGFQFVTLKVEVRALIVLKAQRSPFRLIGSLLLPLCCTMAILNMVVFHVYDCLYDVESRICASALAALPSEIYVHTIEAAAV